MSTYIFLCFPLSGTSRPLSDIGFAALEASDQTSNNAHINGTDPIYAA